MEICAGTFGCVIANYSSDDAKNDRAPWRTEPRCRRSGYKARDSTRTPADHRPFPRKSPVEKRPRSRAEHGCQIGVPASHDGSKISTESGSTVETKPAKPEQCCPKNDQRNIMGSEIDHHFLLASAEDKGVGEGGHTRANFDRPSAGIIENAIFEGPAVRIPRPACNWAVYKSGPKKKENHQRKDAAPLCYGSGNNGCSCRAELHLGCISMLSFLTPIIETYLVKAVE